MSYFGTTQYDLQVKRGLVAGAATVTIIGHSDTVGTNLRQLYHETNTADLDSEALYDTPSTIKVASTDNTADTGAGTGALTVRVSGVNSAGALVTENFTLNGQTETAASSATFKAVHEVVTLTVGSGGSNAGTIWVGTSAATFTSGVPDVKLGAMEIGTNLSAIANYLVPTGKTLYVNQIIIGLGDTNKTMNAQFTIYNGTLQVEAFDIHSQATNLVFATPAYNGVPAGSLVRVNCDVDSGTAKATITLAAFLIDD